MKILYTCLLSLLLITSSQATHILGGFLTYRHISGGTYEIKLTIHRDCNSATPFDGAPGATTDAMLGIFIQGGTLYDIISLGTPQVSTVTIFDTACPSQTAFCMEQGVYTTTFTVPNVANAYNVVHERCCFGGQVVNLFDGGNSGIAFSTHIPASTTTPNSSPVFDSVPSGYTVVNDSINFSYHANDADGDSLVYSFVTLYAGGNPTTPAPNPPIGPPYPPLPWANGYSANNPLGTSTLAIDSATGWVSGLATQVGFYVAGIQIQEYRNNQLLNTNMRMVTFMVDGCFPSNVEEIYASSDFHLFPNPVSDLLTIELNDVTEANLQLLDVNGKVLQEVKLTEKVTSISTTQLPAGYYLAKVSSDNGLSESYRFLKLAD